MTPNFLRLGGNNFQLICQEEPTMEVQNTYRFHTKVVVDHVECVSSLNILHR